MKYDMRLSVSNWRRTMSLRFDSDNAQSRLVASCSLNFYCHYGFQIEGEPECYDAGVEVMVFDTYTTPKQAMLGGVPLGRPLDQSMMEQKPQPIGAIQHLPERYRPELGDEPECISAVIYVGTDTYKDLITRHTSGGAMPQLMSFGLEGFHQHSGGALIWKTTLNPELPIMTVDLHSDVEAEGGSIF